MKLLNKVAFCSFGGLIATVALATSPRATNELTWMTGCWSYDDSDTGSIEQWMAPVNGEMIGMSRVVKDGRMVAFEFMRIAWNDDGKLEFIASPSGQETARFALSSQDHNEVVFENPDHDFPQRISYRLIDSEHLLGRIEGQTDDGEQHVDFPMTRTACATP